MRNAFQALPGRPDWIKKEHENERIICGLRYEESPSFLGNRVLTFHVRTFGPDADI